MFGWEFPPHISGGLGTACAGITRSLAQRGVQVIFVVPKRYGDETEASAEVVGAEEVLCRKSYLSTKLKHVLQVAVPSRIRAYPFMPHASHRSSEREETTASRRTQEPPFRFAGGYGPNLHAEVVRYANIAGQIAKEQRFDIIHAHDWPTFPAAVVAKRISGKPLVAHVHATEYDRAGTNINSQVYDIERMGIHAADLVICVSELTKNRLINFYGADERKLRVVHNGVEHFDVPCAAQPQPKTEKVVTFLGRITYQKGPGYFVEAAHRVLEVLPTVRFVMAGSGDMLPAMEERVAQLGIADRFTFTGFLGCNEVGQLLAQTDVFVMPSVSEPFGIVPLEAMQAGVPAIISRQSGVSEVLHYAIKVDFWDVDSLADAIYGLVAYPALHGYLADNGQLESLGITWDEAGQKIASCYNELVR